MSQRLASPPSTGNVRPAGRARSRARVAPRARVQVALPAVETAEHDCRLRFRVGVVGGIGARRDVGREIDRTRHVALQRAYEASHRVEPHDDVREPGRLGVGPDPVRVRRPFVDAMRQHEEPRRAARRSRCAPRPLCSRVRVRCRGQILDGAVSVVQHHPRVTPPLVQVAEHVVTDRLRGAATRVVSARLSICSAVRCAPAAWARAAATSRYFTPFSGSSAFRK